MKINAKQKSRIAALNKEMERIHFDNHSYWQRGDTVSSEERAAHQSRQDRLEEIRAELTR